MTSNETLEATRESMQEIVLAAKDVLEKHLLNYQQTLSIMA